MLRASEVVMGRRFLVGVLAVVLAGCGSALPTPAATPASTEPASPVETAALLTSAVASGQPTILPASPPASLPPSPVAPVEPSPTPLPPLPGTTALVLPRGTLVTVPLARQAPGSSPEDFAPQPGGPPTGPYVYLGAARSVAGLRHLSVVDLGGGSVRAVPVPLAPDESLADVQASGGRLLVLTWLQQGPRPEHEGVPCGSLSGHPIEWRQLAASIGADGLPAGSWRTLDSGVASRRYADPSAMVSCDDPLVPALASSGDVLAYAVDHPTPAYPAGSRIVLRSLATGGVVRVIDTATQVVDLALSATSVAWVESPNALVPGPVTRWRVMRAPLASGVAAEVPLAVPGRVWRYAPQRLALDGDAVLANPGQSVVGWASVVRSAGSSVVLLNPSPDLDCAPIGGVSGVALLSCLEEGYNERIATWSAGHGLRIVSAPLAADITSEVVMNGWVTWRFRPDPEGVQPVLLGVPFAALVAANR